MPTTIYLKQTMFLRYTGLQLFCIYNLYYMYRNFAREICFVLLHYQHFSQYVSSAQYGFIIIIIIIIIPLY